MTTILAVVVFFICRFIAPRKTADGRTFLAEGKTSGDSFRGAGAAILNVYPGSLINGIASTPGAFHIFLFLVPPRSPGILFYLPMLFRHLSARINTKPDQQNDSDGYS